MKPSRGGRCPGTATQVAESGMYENPSSDEDSNFGLGSDCGSSPSELSDYSSDGDGGHKRASTGQLGQEIEASAGEEEYSSGGEYGFGFGG